MAPTTRPGASWPASCARGGWTGPPCPSWSRRSSSRHRPPPRPDARLGCAAGWGGWPWRPPRGWPVATAGTGAGDARRPSLTAAALPCADRRAGAKAALLVAVCLGLAAISLTVRVSVGEGDPWGWLVWGYELPRGPLDTSAGPAWKPLPVIFTTPFSLFGEAAPTLWLLLTRT